VTVVVGLDLSLTATGVAWIELGAPPAVRMFEIGRDGGNKDPLATRFTRLRGTAGEVIAPCLGADLVVVEQAAFGSSTGHVTDRAGLWWLIVGRLMALGIPVVEVRIAERCTYTTGKGRANKDAIVATVARRYDTIPLTELTNNTADALILAAMGARALGHPIEVSLPKTHLVAMAKVDWPAITTPLP
jgi:crossover junction endodeoxyribonuclease RuvC